MKTPFSEEMLEDAKKTVEDFIKVAGSVRDTHLKEADNWHKHYCVKESVRTYNGRAHTADGSSHENVETATPLLYGVITNNGNIEYEIEPEDSNKDVKFAQAANVLIDKDLKKAKSRKKLVDLCRYVAGYGTVVTSTPWKKYTRTRNTPIYDQQVLGVDNDGTFVVENKLSGYDKRTDVIYEGVDWDIIDLKACWLDPFEPDVDKAQGIVIEQIVAIADLEKEILREEYVDQMAEDGTPIKVKTRVGHYFKEAIEKIKEAAPSGAIEKKQIGAQAAKMQTKDTPRPEITIRSYWGFFDFDGDGIAEDCIITLAGEAKDNMVVIQLEPNTYPSRPFIVSRYIGLPGQTYGLGILGLTSNAQMVVNDMQNQIIDRETQNLLNMWLLQAASDLEDADLVFAANKVIRIDNMEDLQPLRPDKLTGVDFNGIEYVKEGMRSTSGSTRNLQAKPMDYHTTATEINQMDLASSMRKSLPAIAVEEEFIVRLLEHIVEYNAEFGSPDKLMRITNDEELAKAFEGMTVNDLAGQWDFTPLGASKFQRQQKARGEMNEFLMAVQPVMAIPPEAAQAYGWDIGLFMQTLAGEYDIPRSEEIFPSKPQQDMQGAQQVIDEYEAMVGQGGEGI